MSDETPNHHDDEHTREIAREAARAAVPEALRTLGVDTDNPIEVQKDFATLRDIRHLWRKARNAAVWGLVIATTGVLVTALAVTMGLPGAGMAG